MGRTYKYEGYTIVQIYGHYEVYDNREMIFTADTYREATEGIDDIICDKNVDIDSLAFTGQWW